MAERMLFPSVPSEDTVCCLTVPVVYYVSPCWVGRSPRDRVRLRLEAGAEQRCVTGTIRNELVHTLVIDGHDTSALGEGFEATPMVPLLLVA